MTGVFGGNKKGWNAAQVLIPAAVQRVLPPVLLAVMLVSVSSLLLAIPCFACDSGVEAKTATKLETVTVTESEAVTETVTEPAVVAEETLQWEPIIFGDAWDEATGTYTAIRREQAVTKDGRILIREIAESGDSTIRENVKTEEYGPGIGLTKDKDQRLITDSVTGEQYSSRTIIVSVDQEMTDEMMQALLQKYELSVVYHYHSFSMYALSAARALSAEEMETLIKGVSGEPHVLGVSRDRIYHLDDPVRPGNLSIY